MPPSHLSRQAFPSESRKFFFFTFFLRILTLIFEFMVWICMSFINPQFNSKQRNVILRILKRYEGLHFRLLNRDLRWLNFRKVKYLVDAFGMFLIGKPRVFFYHAERPVIGLEEWHNYLAGRKRTCTSGIQWRGSSFSTLCSAAHCVYRRWNADCTLADDEGSGNSGSLCLREISEWAVLSRTDYIMSCV